MQIRIRMIEQSLFTVDRIDMKINITNNHSLNWYWLIGLGSTYEYNMYKLKQTSDGLIDVNKTFTYLPWLFYSTKSNMINQIMWSKVESNETKPLRRVRDGKFFSFGFSIPRRLYVNWVPETKFRLNPSKQSKTTIVGDNEAEAQADGFGSKESSNRDKRTERVSDDLHPLLVFRRWITIVCMPVPCRLVSSTRWGCSFESSPRHFWVLSLLRYFCVDMSSTERVVARTSELRRAKLLASLFWFASQKYNNKECFNGSIQNSTSSLSLTTGSFTSLPAERTIRYTFST